jgi:S-(hydroxymethyl)glutathione dehydrogenase/alcohol dehydrogenase
VKTRAALFRAPGAPLEVREVEVEEPGPDHVLVRMSAVGICGSDLHVVKGEWPRPTPMVLGHEGAGVVEAIGSAVSGVSSGDRVVLSWAPWCGECLPCRAGRRTACSTLRDAIGKGTMLDGSTRLTADGAPVYRMTTIGALAEHVLVPASAALPLEGDLPLDQAALLGCAALTGVGAVLNAARVEAGASVLVLGAGGVGQFVVQGARVAGAAEIVCVDPVEGRREAALALGATRAVPPEDLDAVDEYDYAFDAVGEPETSVLALRAVRRAGTAVLVGIPAAGARLDLDPLEFSHREKHLTGSIYGSEEPATALPRLLELVRDGQIELESVVGPRFPLEQANEAVEASLAGSPGRVLVTMSERAAEPERGR